MARDGYGRSEVAREIGYRVDSFSKLLKQNPDKDPFPSVFLPANYYAETGEPFGAAVKRMAAQGMSAMQVALQVGYSNHTALKRALKARGIEVEFAKIRAVKPGLVRSPQVSRGWPTWAKIYEDERKRNDP